jgi:vacuolar-type H+-ATPase subunit F/Vma7
VIEMRASVIVVGRPATVAGFSLAGLETVEVEDAAAGARRLETLLDRPNLGILLVEDPIHAALSVTTRREIARRAVPLVVPFPGPSFAAVPSAAEAFIVELLRQAIGYRVRLG